MVEESGRLVEAPKVGGRVSRCMVINGDLKSCEPIVIDGTVNGDIISDDSVAVQKGGIVRGKIEAKNILIEGYCEGPLEAEKVELTVGAQLIGYIVATHVRVAGSVDGDVLAREFLEVCKSGSIIAYECISKRVIVKGTIQGEVTAKELLDMKTTATIEGDVAVKELRTEGAGKIFGAISRLESSLAEESEESAASSSKEEEFEQTLQYG